MKIKLVTLTGADDWCNISTMHSLSKKYPFVEWGILFHPNKIGMSRYPTYDWVEKLKPISDEINLSAHLCGGWVNQMKYGDHTFFKHGLSEEYAGIFKRVQLNCYKESLNEILFSKNKFWDCEFNRPYMIGGSYNKEIPVDLFLKRGISPLFDCSGGKGILPKKWNKPVKGLFCGYAGGLNAANLEQQLKILEDTVEDEEIWIDMETGVRDNHNSFDFKLCEEVLEIVNKWKLEK